jgi:invasion protein IalB
MRTCNAQIAIGALGFLVFAYGPAAAASHKHVQKAAPPASEQPAKAPEASDDAGTAAAVARAAAQPVKLVLMPSAMGWIKRCPDAANAVACSVDRGFVADQIAGSTLELSINLLPVADTHLIQLLLPLGVKLRSGFALSLGGEDAYLGTFDRCQTYGCVGEVVLSKAAFDGLMKADKLNVIVGNTDGRTVSIEVSTEGMTAAAAGPSVTAEQLLARQNDFVERRRVATEAYLAKVEAEKAKQKDATNAVPPASGETPMTGSPAPAPSPSPSAK